MRNCKTLLLITLAATTLVSCKAGYNQLYYDNTTNSTATPPCNPGPADGSADERAKKVLRLIATFSCENKSQFNRVMAGQHLGTVGNYVTEDTFTSLMNSFTINSVTPAVLSVEYGATENFSFENRQKANLTLQTHWNKNGLVSISWMPKNPWPSDFTTNYSDNVNLEDLYKDPNNEYYKTWHTQLDEIAKALDDLQQRNVAVLWRPLPAMNTESVWWGIKASTGKGTEAQFEELWKNMFNYLHTTKGLHNLIWVFAPMDTTLATSNKPINWGLYETQVDIVAPIARNNDLTLRDYQDMINTGKPLAMSELSPAYASSVVTSTSSKNFDTALYSKKLTESYPFIAYWVSWNDAKIDDKVHYLSLTSNLNALTTLQNINTITTEKITNNNLFSF